MIRYVIDQTACNKCGDCVTICPKQAINHIGDKYVIDQTACIQCKTCLGECSLSAITAADYDSKTINFDVNKFLTYEDLLKGIYATMEGGFISTYTNATVSQSGEITHAKKNKFITPRALQNNEDDVFNENFDNLHSDVQYGNGSDEYDDDCFLRLKSMIFYTESEKPKPQTYVLNINRLNIFTTYDLFNNRVDRETIYDIMTIHVYDANHKELEVITPDTVYDNDTKITSTWEKMQYPVLVADSVSESNGLTWYKMYFSYDTTSVEYNTVPKYLRIESKYVYLGIYDNIKNYSHDDGDIWYLDECHKWIHYNSQYYERELDDEDVRLLKKYN